jgi:ArsR family transcriptional regulator, arsenate/arsenite/antimonite-responsive transcriptional repressor
LGGVPACTIPYFDYHGIMDEPTAVAALAALAQAARLRVFRALVGAAPEGLTPGELVAMLDIPPSTLSFHLKELMHAGLVSVEREGRNLQYRPALAQMNALLGYLTDHCCQGRACSPSPAARRRSTC